MHMRDRYYRWQKNNEYLQKLREHYEQQNQESQRDELEQEQP